MDACRMWRSRINAIERKTVIQKETMTTIKDQDALFASGCQYIRWEDCQTCGECVEVWLSPGKREWRFDPMPSHESPAIQHYVSCIPKENNNGTTRSAVQDTAGRDSDRGNESPHLDEHARASKDGQEVLPVRGFDARSIKLHGVTDPNYNLLAAGWAEGTLRVRFSKGEGFHVGVPEDLFLKLKHSRCALRQYNLTIKDKFQYTKVE